MAKQTQAQTQAQTETQTAEAQTEAQTQAQTAETEAERKQPHLNVPANAEYLSAVKTWADTHTLPIGKADGTQGRPSVAYALMYLTASALSYSLTDADRTAGRTEVTDAERKAVASVKQLVKQAASLTAEQKAALAALGISL